MREEIKMKTLILSPENWDEFQRIANENQLGVDGTFEYLFSLAHKEERAEVVFHPAKLKELMTEYFDIKGQEGLQAMLKHQPFHYEAVLVLHSGDIKFSNSKKPFFDSTKGQSLDTAIRRTNLKQAKERGVKRLEFSLIENKFMHFHGAEITFDSENISHQLKLIHKDFVSLKPKVTVILNNYFSYEYCIEFLERDYPEYFMKRVNKDHKYFLKYRALNGNLQPREELETALQPRKELETAFIANELNISFSEASLLDGYRTESDDAYDTLIIKADNGEDTTRKIRYENSRRYHAFRSAFPLAGKLNFNRDGIC